MGFGKTIELFLVNGSADSLITAELSNWNGKAIKIPRTEVTACERSDMIGVGVYFLICQEDDGTDSVYIGEAESVKERLLQHLRDYQSGKEPYYWNTAVIFTSEGLNKAYIRYLEYRLVEMAKNSGRYKVLTKNTFKNTVLKESQIASMEEFIENVQILINALGYKVLSVAPKATEHEVLFYCKGNNAKATGFVSSGGFTVSARSNISDHVAKSFSEQNAGYYKLRLALSSDGIIDKQGVFTKDYEFKSPSAASSVITGHATNGNIEWKTADGKLLRELKE